MKPIVDDSRWPLVITTMPASATAEDIDALLTAHNEVLGRGQRYATITDLSRMQRTPGAGERKRLAEWNERNARRIAELNVASAVVVENALIRGALTALNWIRPTPAKEVHVKSLADAKAHCIEALAKEGLAPPAAGAAGR